VLSQWKELQIKTVNSSSRSSNSSDNNSNSHEYNRDDSNTDSYDDKSHDLSSSMINNHVNIDEIVLVGGSSRIPCLRAAIRRGCGRLGYGDFSSDQGE
jgi:molecular chaperone DnaK (HSP70)